MKLSPNSLVLYDEESVSNLIEDYYLVSIKNNELQVQIVFKYPYLISRVGTDEINIKIAKP